MAIDVLKYEFCVIQQGNSHFMLYSCNDVPEPSEGVFDDDADVNRGTWVER